MTEKTLLTHPDSSKETRHHVFQLGDSGMTYKVGDALAIIPHNPLDLVEDILVKLNFTGDEVVETHAGEVGIRDALTNHYEVHRLNKKFLQSLEEKFADAGPQISVRLVSRNRSNAESGEQALEWTWGGEDDDFPEGFTPLGSIKDPSQTVWEGATTDADSIENYIWSRDYLDLLNEMPTISFTPQEFVETLDRLKPRLYSIASSPDAHPGEVHLTVGIVRYEHHGRKKGGLCTIYMADIAPLDEEVIPMFMSPTRSFVLPPSGDVDIIMVGPGTGIAPFRAFLEQRKFDKATGRNWLFFGDRTETHEYLYRDELEAWVDEGFVRLDNAWSRMADRPKTYVQHLMAENGEEIWEWISNGGYFYVCGDKQYMAKDVHKTLIEIAEKYGEMSAEDAKSFVEQTLMKEEKRYLRDVY
tara:strand:- start:192 stop:1433 length:1242 start_codon:yes stop_codon:yes gene_type:complete